MEFAGKAIELAPIEARDRISSIDLLRGVSLLGILLMNIVSFAQPGPSGDDPTVFGGATGWNLYIWAINFILFDGKMRAIFSMLFGASTVILTSRLEKRGAGIRTADIYYRRTMWLLAFGALHAYFLWAGDILFAYALIGLLLFPLRNVAPKWLFVAGLVVLATGSLKELGEAHDMQTLHDKALSGSQDDRDAWQDRLDSWKPSKEDLQKEIAAHRGSYGTLFDYRAGNLMNSEFFFTDPAFDIAGMMLIGMALFKTGFLSAARSSREYGSVAAVGLGLGIAVNIHTALSEIHANFDALAIAWPQALYQCERLLMGLGYVSIVMLISRAGGFRWLTSRIGAIGQMALSGYLTHTLICTTIFDRFGFFGHWQRYQLYYVVAAIWIFQIGVSKPWLDRFRFGPFEWLWRSLTYWKRQPMCVKLPAAATSDSAA